MNNKSSLIVALLRRKKTKQGEERALSPTRGKRKLQQKSLKVTLTRSARTTGNMTSRARDEKKHRHDQKATAEEEEKSRKKRAANQSTRTGKEGRRYSTLGKVETKKRRKTGTVLVFIIFNG